MAVWRITRQIRRMRRDWDQRARENARYYVVTGQDRWSDEEFYESGQLQREMLFKNNLQHGPEKQYAADGKLEKTKYFLDGEEVPEGVYKDKYKS